MNKNIEVEIRGPLSKKEFNSLIKLFENKGKKTLEKNRILIDYSTFLEGCEDGSFAGSATFVSDFSCSKNLSLCQTTELAVSSGRFPDPVGATGRDNLA